jgi:hypothetical protein
MTAITPTNLGKPATLHVEAIINGRQIGIAIVDGQLIQCADLKWSTQAPKAGMSIEQAANGAAEMLLARGGVRFV